MNNMTVIALPASVNYTAEQALNSALMKELTDVLVLGYDSAGVLIIRSSKMTRAEGLFMTKKAEQWVMEGGADWYDSRITAFKEALAQPQQKAIYGMNPDDWKDLTDAVKKVRDGRGMPLACKPADVFQDWFLWLGTAKIKDKDT